MFTRANKQEVISIEFISTRRDIPITKDSIHSRKYTTKKTQKNKKETKEHK